MERIGARRLPGSVNRGGELVRSIAMTQGNDERALIEAYFDVIRDGGIDRLAGIVTDDYVDHDRMRAQMPGRFGVMQKTLWFREQHPGAVMVIEDVVVTFDGAPGSAGGPPTPIVRATWTTKAPHLDGTPAITTWRYVGEFELRDGKIRSSKVERIGQVGAPA